MAVSGASATTCKVVTNRFTSLNGYGLTVGAGWGHPRSKILSSAKLGLVSKTRTLRIWIDQDDETGRWYVAESEVPGIRLEAVDSATLIRRIENAAPEIIELNSVEIRLQHKIAPDTSIRLKPVVGSPLSVAA